MAYEASQPPSPAIAASPVSEQAFAQAMDAVGPFETSPHIALALSGGADSMALALLTQHWCARSGGRLTALTVDHGLRSASAQEAAQTAKLCKRLGIEHHILQWHPGKLGRAIQAQARDARYRLLAGWCTQNGVLHLLTAHHRDDQAETLFFRLARGSGLDGLACMPVASCSHGIRLLRPLLFASKAQLLATLDMYQQPWVDDPSNQSGAYTRNVLRQQLQATRKQDIVCHKAAQLAARFGNIRSHMEKHTASYLANSATLMPEGCGLVSHAAFLSLPDGYAHRVLSSVLQAVGGKHYRLRTEKLARLLADMRLPTPPQKRTLGGLILALRPKTQQWLIYREPKAVQSSVMLLPGQRALWDGRFEVMHHGRMPLSLAALTPAGMRQLQASAPSLCFPVDKPVAASLPVLWHLEKPVAVPHIGYHHPDYTQLAATVRFIPAKPLADTAFFGFNTASQNEAWPLPPQTIV